MAEISFTKGHGTGNDFVLFADPDGELDLTPRQLATIADRHFGVGADGVIRAVRSRSLPDGAAALAEDDAAEWFMDYHNSDGSPSEMCGNGIRVYAKFLLENGLAELRERRHPADRHPRRRPRRAAQPQRLPGRSRPLAAGRRRAAGARQEPQGGQARTGHQRRQPARGRGAVQRRGARVRRLSVIPIVEPEPIGGVNVEFVVPVDPMVQGGIGHIRMRVHERGSGETLSCGTGAVAAALATRHWAGAGAPNRWKVEVPGGTLGVRMWPAEDGEHVSLSGPAEFVYSGVIEV